VQAINTPAQSLRSFNISFLSVQGVRDTNGILNKLFSSLLLLPTQTIHSLVAQGCGKYSLTLPYNVKNWRNTMFHYQSPTYLWPQPPVHPCRVPSLICNPLLLLLWKLQLSRKYCSFNLPDTSLSIVLFSHIVQRGQIVFRFGGLRNRGSITRIKILWTFVDSSNSRLL